jgi:hypothetical protein
MRHSGEKRVSVALSKTKHVIPRSVDMRIHTHTPHVPSRQRGGEIRARNSMSPVSGPTQGLSPPLEGFTPFAQSDVATARPSLVGERCRPTSVLQIQPSTLGWLATNPCLRQECLGSRSRFPVAPSASALPRHGPRDPRCGARCLPALKGGSLGPTPVSRPPLAPRLSAPRLLSLDPHPISSPAMAWLHASSPFPVPPSVRLQ